MALIESTTMTETADAGARSALYRLLAEAFNFPTPDLYESVESGEFFAAVDSLMSALPHLGGAAPWAEKLSAAEVDFDGLTTEYIRLFDVGTRQSGAPCKLYGGEYLQRPRLDVMEELVRFYEYFGLTLSAEDRELPDHLSVELEFLHYLAFKEFHAARAGSDPSPYQRAQADFIERHPGNWVPLMAAKLQEQAPPGFFAGLVVLTTQMLRSDLAYLRTIAGEKS